MSIQERISENRPHLSASSVNTYSILAKRLFYRYHEKDTPINFEWFNETETILKDIESRPLATQKTILSAVIAVCPDNRTYRDTLLYTGKKYQENIDKQEKSQTQSANWMEFSEIKTIFDTMQKELKPILNSKGEISQYEFMRLQDLVLLAVTTGIFISPRRSTDWTHFKVRSIDKETDNYMDKDSLVFNIYKTKKFYGKQTIVLPKALKTIITKYLNHNPYDYLFVNVDGTPLTNVTLGRRLNHIFGRNLSTNLLRHIFLTDKMGSIPSLIEMKQTANDMAHSVEKQLEYIKR